jgi:hypothetical protein
MSNVECQMNDECQMSKDPGRIPGRIAERIVLRHLSFDIRSSFDIRHLIFAPVG